MGTRTALAALLAVAAAGPARADAADQPAARLDLRLGLGRRDDSLAAPAARATADGGALSDLALAAAWFGRSPHVGLAGRLALERFELRSEAPATGDASVVGGAAFAGPALRGATEGGRLACVLALGYGVLRVPVVYVGAPAPMPVIAGGALRAHGPAASLDFTLALGARWQLELGGEAAPLAFGGRYQGVAVSPRRFSVRASAAWGRLLLAGVHWAAVAHAELGRTTATGDGVEIRQLSQHVGLGLRAVFPAAPIALAPPPARPPAPPRQAVIAGVVRSQAGAALVARVRLVELGLERATDAQGSFLLAVPPGHFTLVIGADGYVSQTKAVDAAGDEQRIFNVELQPEAP